MAKRLRTCIALAGIVLLAGCYHAVVRTGAQSSATAPTHTIWANSWIAGLIPPPEVDAGALCSGRPPAVVETQHTFLNSVVAALTFSIYTPMTIQITC